MQLLPAKRIIYGIISAMTNWNARDISIDLSFLGEGNFEAEIFKDGLNADRDATDYAKELEKLLPMIS